MLGSIKLIQDTRALKIKRKRRRDYNRAKPYSMAIKHITREATDTKNAPTSSTVKIT